MVLSAAGLLKPLYQHNIMLWDLLHFENCVYSVKLYRVKEKQKINSANFQQSLLTHKAEFIVQSY